MIGEEEAAQIEREAAQEAQDAEPVKLGPGVSFRMEKTSVSAPCDPPDGVNMDVLDRLKNLCTTGLERKRAGCIASLRHV